MRGDLLDVILLVAMALFAFTGYRQGFVVGLLSFVGFLGGGVLGAVLLPHLAASGPLSGLSRPVLAIVVVFVGATVGQALLTFVASKVRDKLVWKPFKVVDSIAGAVISVVSLLLIAYLVGTAVSSASINGLSSQVRRSEVLALTDKVVPGVARQAFASFRRFADDRGFPSVFGDLVPTQARPVDPPDPALAMSAAVRLDRSRVYKIVGIAPSCSRRVEGSGFLYAPHHVMTNAHVLAGVKDPTVDGRSATVVYFNSDLDIAVLNVPSLTSAPLVFAGQVGTGTGAIVVGYPENGPFRADAARVRMVQEARGPNIYETKTVERQIYALRAHVRPGNSGGPLLDTSGRVLGVVFAAAADDSDTGYALTAKAVAGAAAVGRTATARVSTHGCD